jgi:hypothetical protein
MKLKDLKKGDKFLFADEKVLTSIYEVKGKINDGYFLVGTPGVYDVFASHGDTEVIV